MLKANSLVFSLLTNELSQMSTFVLQPPPLYPLFHRFPTHHNYVSLSLKSHLGTEVAYFGFSVATELHILSQNGAVVSDLCFALLINTFVNVRILIVSPTMNC